MCALYFQDEVFTSGYFIRILSFEFVPAPKLSALAGIFLSPKFKKRT